ncbi:hypothetical protein [Belliella pelovolcani]|uniref:hypothetical protein n=1 Tax=Belliella pelovolcani TaxID=529505 RepID=UPI00391C4625
METGKKENDEVLQEVTRNELRKIDPSFYFDTDFIEDFQNKIREFEKRNENEFKKTLKSMKGFFLKEGLIFPKDWKEVFYSWYVLVKLGEKAYDFSFSDLSEKISDRQIYLEWAKYETEKLILEINKENEDTENKREKELPASVKFELINLIFDEKAEFKVLQENQREKLLSYILGVGSRTAKGMKNGETKYINSDHADRAKVLFEKIKKGDFL